MELFDVYPLMDVTPISGKGCYVTDERGTEYLDLYGGHAVISIGHSHPHYVKRISDQLEKIGFYSNSVINPLQQEFARKLGELSGLNDYNLFLCNSGAEANENALKLASFTTGKKRVIAFDKAFHGRTSAAVSVTDNVRIQANINKGMDVSFLPLNEAGLVEEELKSGDVCAVIIEGIQGIGGVQIPKDSFLKELELLCKKYDCKLILDEIQSGYGRSGMFFAFQYADIKPDIITTAKGMANGFPIGGVLINPDIEARHGMLGATFGGNYLACAAGLAVLEVMESEALIRNAAETGEFLLSELGEMDGIKEVRGRGLMIGLEFDSEVAGLRKKLVKEEHIFTGVSSTNIIRLLPPLSLTVEQATVFTKALGRLLAP
ncbi:aspartate aminotransferase family protein [Marinilabilia salmonicolor]|jgi:acetylornithine aminotransferase|uniref:Acetylornithine aminotransferase n=1 Tax=Marinilabilia salmonicolor TaxID=989 RepID=A0A2T0XT08_9BACT|nr:aminotransferase class III-fold pyridoxal phosphate-dependent enzyme [Marinilabilia salmonicolor]PRZ02071.1 acetylornithine aminotransferase [Marinilabilia salmonicolor]RCW39505.1 acetylornithine aminotransferase [Marinilabilia salmonicolor]